MRILVGWDNSAESETISLLLNVDESIADVHTESGPFEEAANRGGWDVVLITLNFPSPSESYALFERIRLALPESPIIGAWIQGELTHLARFISNGLHSYLLRDSEGEFIFLLASMVEAAHSAMQSQRARILAERLREEVDSVRRLQESVITTDLPKPPGYKITARYEPSQIRVVGNMPVVMAGGDYYDVFALDATTLIMLIGDASGHGVKACMSIMTMHTLLRMIRDKRYSKTADFVQEVNRFLCTSDIVKDEGGFITLLYTTLDLQSNKLQFTSAGQPMPLLQNLETNEIARMGTDEDGGLPLAIDEDWKYEQKEVIIPVNSRVLIYTDGLEEAFPAEGDEWRDQFGLEGIMNTMRDTVNAPLEEVLNRLFHDSNAATAGSGRHDDTSIVLLERREVQEGEGEVEGGQS